MTKRMSDKHATDLFTCSVGAGIGIMHWFLNLNQTWVLGEVWKLIEAVILGGLGAFGAWLIRRFVIANIEKHGTFSAWIKLLFKRKTPTK
jgi:hypothetical protein